jgi:hypothetical protein
VNGIVFEQGITPVIFLSMMETLKEVGNSIAI